MRISAGNTSIINRVKTIFVFLKYICECCPHSSGFSETLMRVSDFLQPHGRGAALAGLWCGRGSTWHCVLHPILHPTYPAPRASCTECSNASCTVSCTPCILHHILHRVQHHVLHPVRPAPRPALRSSCTASCTVSCSLRVPPGLQSHHTKQLWWGTRNSSTCVIGNFSCWVQRFCCSICIFFFQQLSPGSIQRACAFLSLKYFPPNKENNSAVPLIYEQAISIQQKDTWNTMVLRILCNLSHFSHCQGAYKKLKSQILLLAFLGPNYKYIFTRRSQLKPNIVRNFIISIQSSLDVDW